jgi:hypothetical protein
LEKIAVRWLRYLPLGAQGIKKDSNKGYESLITVEIPWVFEAITVDAVAAQLKTAVNQLVGSNR